MVVSMSLRSRSNPTSFILLVVFLRRFPHIAVDARYDYDDDYDEDYDDNLDDLPGRTHIESIEELNLQEYEEKVIKMINGSIESPSYFPLVLFHLPWCQHCQMAIPEFRAAAVQIAQAEKAGKFKRYTATPRFFMFSCESESVRAVCEYHAGRSYPSIVLFRDRRPVRFNRPRSAEVITWWAHRVCRPELSRVDTEEQVESYISEEVAFLVSASERDHQTWLEAWSNIALDSLDRFVILLTDPGSSLGRHIGSPSVTVRGPRRLGLSPKPLELAEPNRSTMEAWMEYNQFGVVTNLTTTTLHELKFSSNFVVALAHGGETASIAIRRQWNEKAAELRRDSGYLFAALNYSEEESYDLASNNFPLVGTTPVESPYIFVFTTAGGRFRYWEDPLMSSIENLTLAGIEALLRDEEALQEDSTLSWLKEKRKMYKRFSARSWIHLVIAVTMPIALVACCWVCCKGLLNDDSPEEWGQRLHERLREIEEKKRAGEMKGTPVADSSAQDGGGAQNVVNQEESKGKLKGKGKGKGRNNGQSDDVDTTRDDGMKCNIDKKDD